MNQPSKRSCVLTALQLWVIELVAQGLKNSEVAEAIGTTENVVKNYLRVIYDRLGFWNRAELALWYEAHRIESPAPAGRDRSGLKATNGRHDIHGVLSVRPLSR